MPTLTTPRVASFLHLLRPCRWGLSPPGDRPQAGGRVTSLGTTSYRVYLFEVTPVLGKGKFHCVIVVLI